MSSNRTPLIQHQGVAAPMLIDNIDTDQIIPSREMTKVSRDGLGEGLFAGWRYKAPGTREIDEDFVLNQLGYAGASIILGGRNFGCGSSREHAVWALKEYGVKVIIAASFGEIFYGNCIRNGILPIILDHAVVAELAKHVALDPQKHQVSVDLEGQTVTATGREAAGAAFEIGEYHKRLLMEGLDPIRLTLMRRNEIEEFLNADAGQRPWVYN